MADWVYLKGKFKWCRPNKPDPWGNWKTDFYPTSEDMEKFRELKKTHPTTGALGIRNVIKKDDDGEFITVRRPLEKEYGGVMKGFVPPMMLDGTKKMDDGNYMPLPIGTLIGNGSDGVLKIEVYSYRDPTSKGKARAIRWAGGRIDNLVPFEGKKDYSPDEEKQAEGFDKQPAAEW